MIRLLTLVLALAAGASAQVSPDALAGDWTVDRYTSAQPAASDALVPEMSLLIYTAARFETDGQVVVTIVSAEPDGYAVRDVPMAYTLDGDQLAVLMDDVTIRFDVALDGDALSVSNAEGTLHLRRDR